MKLSYVLLNVLLVGGGILIYDTVKGDPQPTTAAVHDELLRADDLTADPEPEERVVLLDGGGEGILAKRNANRIEDLENQIAVLLRRRSEGGGTDGAPRAADAPPLAIEQPDVDNGVATNFDERTLTSMEQYMDEINRRKMVERQRNRITGELTRLGVELQEDQANAVVDLTLSYQQKARDLLRKTWSRDEKGREDRKQAYEQLRTDYTTSLNRLVPTAEAEKIASSRLSRGLGFTGSSFTGRRGVDRSKGRDSRRNREDR